MAKEELIKFRVSREQKQKIETSAKKCGYSVSAFCLATVLKHKPKQVQSKEFLELLDEFRAFYEVVKESPMHRKQYEDLFLKIREMGGG